MRVQVELNPSGQATATQCHSYVQQGVILAEGNFPRTFVFEITYCHLLKSTRMPTSHFGAPLVYLGP